MSLLKANSVQIGQSATATQNFTLSVPASPDGTIKLARGNSGATTADVLTVDASGNVTTTLAASSIPNASIAAPKLNGAQDGSAPIYGVRAWCVFNGTLTGTNAPTAGGNIASITRNSVSDYTVTFATAMPSANYAVHISAQPLSNNPPIIAPFSSTASATPNTPTASSFRFSTYNYNYTAYAESPRITIIVVG